jgi:hypothetical protein
MDLATEMVRPVRFKKVRRLDPPEVLLGEVGTAGRVEVVVESSAPM